MENFKGEVELLTPKNWSVNPSKQEVFIKQAGAVQEFVFEVTPPEGSSTAVLSSIVKERGINYGMSLETIDYPHISKQHLLQPNKAIASKIDLKKQSSKSSLSKRGRR